MIYRNLTISQWINQKVNYTWVKRIQSKKIYANYARVFIYLLLNKLIHCTEKEVITISSQFNTAFFFPFFMKTYWLFLNFYTSIILSELLEYCYIFRCGASWKLTCILFACQICESTFELFLSFDNLSQDIACLT